MQRYCLQENCTVADSGICLLNNDPASCAYRSDEFPEIDSSKPESTNVAMVEEPDRNIQFPSSNTLSLEELRNSIGERYFRLVGILGFPDAGKTALLVSLYLLISSGKLSGFSYSNSLTLMAFDEISRGARRWNSGKIPEQLTTHTKLADHRDAGFLHMRIKPSDCKNSLDLLFPDLPGEWTTALINSNRDDRLKFLARADVVWLVVDGKQFIGDRLNLTLHRMKLLIERVAGLITTSSTVILVVTHNDLCEPDSESVEQLCEEASERGLTMKPIHIASFSDDNSVEPGSGIAELISLSTKTSKKTPEFWPDSKNSTTNTLSMSSD